MQSQVKTIKTRMSNSKTEDKMMENKEAEKKSKRNLLDHESRLRELSNSIKRNNIHIIRVPEDEEREKGAEGLFEQIIDENFPNLGKEIGIQVQEAQTTPIKSHKNRSTP